MSEKASQELARLKALLEGNERQIDGLQADNEVLAVQIAALESLAPKAEK